MSTIININVLSGSLNKTVASFNAGALFMTAYGISLYIRDLHNGGLMDVTAR